MTVTAFGIQAIIAFEGFRPQKYLCPAGVWTQGIGHTAAIGGAPLTAEPWSKEHAILVLQEDLAILWKKIEPHLKIKPDVWQKDAMLSLAFNIGAGAFIRSSVLRFFNKGEFAQAAAAFGLWVKATVNGRKQTLNGLVRRRATEALMFQGIMDLDFDGRRDPNEPIYGDMPQAVEPAREPVEKTAAAQGSAAAGAGGLVVAIASAQEALTTAEPHINAGTWIGIALGVVILAGAAVALYSRWVAAGRPNPFHRGP